MKLQRAFDRFALLLASGGLLAGARSQDQAHTLWQSVSTTGSLAGASVARVGDTNGDGVPEILVGAPLSSPGGATNAGEARLLSGSTGAVLLTVPGAAAFDQAGAAVAGIGDLSGDGIPDLLVGAPQPPFDIFLPPPPGRVRAHSGANGAVLFTVTGTAAGNRFGISLAPVGDANGDGVPDFVVGAHEPPIQVINPPGPPPGPGFVRLCSGVNGATLFTDTGTAAGDAFGFAVAPLGDLDGDGVTDVAVGAPGSLTTPPVAGGYVRVLSGANLAALSTIPSPTPSVRFGFSVAGLGDADGDAVPDLVVGDRLTARVLSGASGAILVSSAGSGAAIEEYGSAVAGAGDANGDGVPDFLVGAPQPPVGGFGWADGFVEARSGANGALLYTLEGTAPGARFGTSIVTAGDLDGDGLPEWAIGSPGTVVTAAGTTTGTVRLASSVGLPPGSFLLGSGCAGSGGIVPRIGTAAGFPLPGNGAFAVVISRALGGTPAILAVGASSQLWNGIPLPLPLGGAGLPGCALEVSADALFVSPTIGSGAGDGAVFFPFPIPPDPNLVALPIFFQGYVVDPGPAVVPGAMSPGIRVLIL